MSLSTDASTSELRSSGVISSSAERRLPISEAWRRYDLSSLKRVTYGTEVMPPGTLARLHQVLPAVDAEMAADDMAAEDDMMAEESPEA